MANHPQALKRHRQSIKHRIRNRFYKKTMRTYLSQVREAVAAGDSKTAEAAFAKTQRYIDKVASKGIIHRSTGARLVSRLAQLVRAPR